jgi:hypothetical protein
MLAKCISAVSNGSQYALTANATYLVLGISVVMENKSGAVLYQVLNDVDGISHAPASIFELEDGKCSAYWVARHDPDGSLLLWPEEFFVKYFHDDLSDGRKAAVDSFNAVVARLKKEAGISA